MATAEFDTPYACMTAGLTMTLLEEKPHAPKGICVPKGGDVNNYAMLLAAVAPFNSRKK